MRRGGTRQYATSIRTRYATSIRTAVAVALAGLLLAACGSGGSSWKGGNPDPADGVKFAITPAEGATDVAVSAEIEAKITGGTLSTVALATTGGKDVSGEMRSDGSSWVPGQPLDYGTEYAATVTAKSTKGKAVTKTTKFTTMQRPGNRMAAHIFMADNATYGQAMPIVVQFGQGGSGGVAKANRATVERRLFVKSDPPQPGVWHWDSGIQAEYRPKEFWQPGTKLDIRLGLGGLPIGDGRYGSVDITIKASIDTVRRQIDVDNATKRLTATQDGQVVKTAPVSLGRADKPSLSGTLVIIERLDKTTFDSSTYGTPVNSKDGYRTEVQFAERLTWDGQFIHAAPWSVAQQGHTNVSHGCVNVSTENGQWIYNWVKVGDPVVVKGTGKDVNEGNGWTAWSLPWDDFAAGSALAAGPSASASPSPARS